MKCCRKSPCEHPGIGPCDMPAEIHSPDRIMSMSDAEIFALYRAEGLDPEAEAEKVRLIIASAIERASRGGSNG